MENLSNNERGFVLSTFPSTGSPNRNCHLLTIGINEYAHFTDLNNAVKDIIDLKKLLIEQYQFEEEHTLSLTNTNATRDNILMALEAYVNQLTEEDNLMIYFSGHGHIHRRTSRGYWVPTDARINKPADYIPNTLIKEYLEVIHAHHILVVSDSCFSGSLFRRGKYRSYLALEELDKIGSRWAFCSGRHDERVYDGIPGTNSPFAKSLLEAFDASKADKLNISRLIDVVTKLTRDKYDQLPEGGSLQGDSGGQFIFYRKLGDKEIWEKIIEKGKVEDYKHYLTINPKGEFAHEALTYLYQHNEDLIWNKLQYSGQLKEYKKLLNLFPNGKYVQNLIEKILALEEEALWDIVKNNRARSNLLRYLSFFPEGKYVPKAHSILSSLSSHFEQSTVIRPYISLDITRTCTRLAVVQGGVFDMGSNFFSRERPIHQVKLSSFEVAIYPITFMEFDHFCEIQGLPKPPDEGGGRGMRPAVNVTWYQCLAYCNWLSRINHLPLVYQLTNGRLHSVNFDCQGFRLLTEAEWEYAARGGRLAKNTFFSGSNRPKEVAWYDENSGNKIKEVAKKASNELGIYDMSGNVYEWCFDFWSKKFYQNFIDKLVHNPKGPSDGITRVVRGGSYKSQDEYCRVAYRDDCDPSSFRSHIGFRVGRTM